MVQYFFYKPIKESVELDACFTGPGGRWNLLVYKLDIEKHYHDFTTVHVELLNFLVTIRLCGNHWASQKVILNCDNQDVISVLTIR